MSTPLAAEQLRLVGLLLLLMLMAQVLLLRMAVLLHWPPPSPPSWSWMVPSCLRERRCALQPKQIPHVPLTGWIATCEMREALRMLLLFIFIFTFINAYLMAHQALLN